MKIGILSTFNHPLLPHILLACQQLALRDICIICDALLFSEKDALIWQSRTGSALDKIGNVSAEKWLTQQSGYPFYFVDHHNSEMTLELVKRLKLDALANGGTPRKLNSHVIQSCHHGVINVHPGELPKYRGCSCVEWTLLNKDTPTNTAHIMTEEYDAGPILAMESYSDLENQPYKWVRQNMYLNMTKLMAKTLQNLKHLIENQHIQDEKKAVYWKPMPDSTFNALFKSLAGHTAKEHVD